MAKVKLNGENDLETLCKVKLSKDKYPKVYEAKVQELMNEGISREEAEQALTTMEFELELYYSPSNGMFAVESDAIECGATIYDPYTGEECEPYDE